MLLAETVGKVSFTVDGQSHWQGVTERSISFSVLDPALIGPDKAKFGNPLQVLRIGLGNLAAWYEQEAIALVVGTSELVSPSKRYAHEDGETRYFDGPEYLRANAATIDRNAETEYERSELTNRVTKLDNDLSANCHHGK